MYRAYYQERIKSGISSAQITVCQAKLPYLELSHKAYGGAYDDELKTHWCRHMHGQLPKLPWWEPKEPVSLKKEINKAEDPAAKLWKEAEYASCLPILILQLKEVL
jgi:hypothetical protein